MSLASQRRARLAAHPDLLRGILRGIEKEGLRVDNQGNLAMTPHPLALGSALANPQITTDYSEALLELITRPHDSAEGLIAELTDIHRFVALRNPDELLWNQSMPARLPAEKDIPVGWYGTSNTGMLKHVYRLGLEWRYGKIMQCIAGLHYNFSLPEAAWDLLADGATPMDRRNNGYMALIRNFIRQSWLLMYLFGASPALSASFLQKARLKNSLVQISPETYCLPHATSLRMSDLGYTNTVQSELQLCYNDLETFTSRIYNAVTTPWPDYQAIGTHRNGKRIQLNTNLLQIENEYYSSIRPKQTTGRCERPNTILRQRGIQYVEVRCMDIDPWSPAGINTDTSRFLDVFLLYCAIEESPCFPAPGHCVESQENFSLVARKGREPGLELMCDEHPVALQEWACQILSAMQPYAELLDQIGTGKPHQASLAVQQAKIDDADATPSGLMMSRLRSSKQEYLDWTLEQSKAQWEQLKATPLPDEVLDRLDRAAADSIRKQAEIEAADSIGFEEYVEKFHAALT